MQLPLVLAAILLVAFAGCIDDPAPATRPGDDVGVVTDPGDFSYLGNTSGPGAHVHDYWNGQDVRTVVDEVDGCTSCSASYSGTDRGALLGAFRPATDHVVPQGAAWIHVNATWFIEDGSYGEVALYVKTANTTDAEYIGPLEQGRTITFNSTNDDNDPPHHRLSLWVFEVRARPPAGSDTTEIVNWEVGLTVQAERGLPIPPYPAHPDLWQGATEIVLHDSTRDVSYDIGTPSMSMCSGCIGWHDPDDGKIVPYDASRVEVTLTVNRGLPPTLRLLYHGADTWTFSEAPVESESATERVWHLDVEGRPDSPYAKQSLWEFRLEPEDDAPAWAWTGEYRLVVRVVK